MVRVSSSKTQTERNTLLVFLALFRHLIRVPQGELSGTVPINVHMYSHIYLDHFYCPHTFDRKGEQQSKERDGK